MSSLKAVEMASLVEIERELAKLEASLERIHTRLVAINRRQRAEGAGARESNDA